MKFHIDIFFLLSMIFAKGANADLRKVKGDIIADEYIVVLKHSARRRLVGVSGDIAVNAMESLANEMGANMGVNTETFSVKDLYTSSIAGFSMKGSKSDAEKIAQDKYVAFVEPNQVIDIDRVGQRDLQQTDTTWGIDRVDQRDLPLNSVYDAPGDGTGVAAYILDTGVQIAHDEFGDRARWGENTSGDGDDRDCHGHGTHVAGTVGGTTYGVAKNVEIIAVKVLTCSGSGSTTGVINGVEWTAQDAAAKGKPATANMSLGGGFSTALNAAVKALNNGGVPTVVAAGNDNGNACTKSPASEPDVITVGSTTISDARSSFSNFGTCVDIFAPGSSITAAWIGNNNSTIRTISGTSMASPHVCGGVALLLEAGISPDNIAEEIVSRATSDKVTDPQNGSPNKLLYVGSVGPTNSPTPAPPTPAPTPCIQATVEVKVTTDNYPAETAWTLKNNCENSVDDPVSPNYPTGNTAYTEELCVPNAEYTFTITDEWGDGMCCGYGSGSYEVTYNGVDVAGGGQFTNSESTTFGSCAPPSASPTRNPIAAPVGDSPEASPISFPVTSPVEDEYEVIFEENFDDLDSGFFDGNKKIVEKGGANYAYDGEHSLRLKKTNKAQMNGSVTVSEFSTVKLEFQYYGWQMEDNDYFRVMFNLGGWTEVGKWTGAEFNDDVWNQAVVTWPTNGKNKLKMRFELVGNSGKDRVFIDSIRFSGL